MLLEGTKVVVEREQILGSRLDRELSDITLGPPVRGNILRAPLPTGGWTLEWKALGLDPQAIERVLGVWYLSATPMRCDGYDNWGRPVPPYVFFKYTGDAWQRISGEAFPAEIAKRNLTYWGSGAHRSAVAGGYISAEHALKVSPGIGLPDYVNNVYRSGTKGVEACWEDFKLQDRARGK